MGTLYYLAVGLGIFAVITGSLKVAPIEPGHSSQTSLMHRISGVFPLQSVGFQPSASMYCAIFALVEVVCGTLLAFGRNDWPLIGGFGLMILLILIIHGQLALGAQAADFVVTAVCLALLAFLMFSRGGLWGRTGKVHLS